MKKYFIYMLAAVCIAPFMTSCSEDDLSSESVITTDKVDETEFDKWLNQNFVLPYNIEFKYRYEYNESDENYYTVPAEYWQAVEMAHIVKHTCVEAYDEVAGNTFTRTYFPKMFFLIGEWEYKNNGTFILGTAEGGKKILLAGVNYIDKFKSSLATLNTYYLKTIHHEFTHILNQTKDYSSAYQLITLSDYVADNWSEEPYDSGYLGRGFISAYSQHSHGEDFAEMVSMYVTNTEEQWDTWMATAAKTTNDDGTTGKDRLE